MQNNRKNLGILLIIIGLILLILIIYFGFFKKAPAPALPPSSETEISGQLPTTPETSSSTPGDKPRNYQKYNVAAEAPHQINANDVAKLAMSFAERLGSYSNQSNYGNFTDLKIFMTPSLQAWADKYVETLRSQASSTAYYGISTRAVTSEIKNFDDKQGQAEILVLTERRESTEKIGGGESYPQALSLDLVRINGEWLVDKAYWEKK